MLPFRVLGALSFVLFGVWLASPKGEAQVSKRAPLYDVITYRGPGESNPYIHEETQEIWRLRHNNRCVLVTTRGTGSPATPRHTITLAIECP